MARRWRVEYPSPEPVEVECPQVGYPCEDEDGCKQYQNTHFVTRREALEYLAREAKAHVSLVSRGVRNAREQLAQAEAELVRASLGREAIEEALRLEVTRG